MTTPNILTVVLLVAVVSTACSTSNNTQDIPKGRETPPVVARLSQNCWLSNTSENHPVEVFNYGSEAFF